MKLIRNLSWIFFANAFASFSKWLIVILIAKTLNATDVGIYSLAFAVSAPITLFANMKLRSLYITSSKNDIENYLVVRNIFSVLVLIFLIFIGFLFYSSHLTIIVLVGLTKILDLYSDLYYALPHKKNNLDMVGKLLLIKNVMLIILFAMILIAFNNLIIALFAQVLFQATYLIIIERSYAKRNSGLEKIKPSRYGIREVILLGLPLGVVQMLFSLNANIPRYFLEYVENSEVLGYFSAVMYIAVISNLFMGSISQVMLPKLSYLMKVNKMESLKKFINFYLTLISALLSLIMLILSFFFGEDFLRIVYGEGYADYHLVLVLVVISVAINLFSWNYDTGLMVLRYISVQPKITLFTFLITIISSYYFITSYGIYGAAYTLILANFVQLMLRVYFVNKKINNIINIQVGASIEER